MSCSNCGGGDVPNGCKSNGSCGSGGCNKLEVFNWLANMDSSAGESENNILEIRFKNGRKNFYKNTKKLSLVVGDVVVVEGNPGLDTGVVSIVGELTNVQMRKKAPRLKMSEVKRIIKKAEQEDIDKWIKGRDLERDVMYKARTLAVNLNLQMKISDVEYQGDLTKATFYYTAEGRVDFRQLIKDMAEEFHIRIEMKQIGSRQEAARLGGIGSCGRELCCSTWLTDFRSVSTSAARYQQLSLNPQKLAGQCGKLKCCLNYELDSYLDALKAFPKGDLKLRTVKGTAFHVKTDVFKQEMWYMYNTEGSTGPNLIALSPDRVREVIRLNKSGENPTDLKDYIVETVVEEPDYTNVVGQDSLNRFEHIFKKKKGNSNRRKKKPSAGKPKGQGNENQKVQGEKQVKKKPNNPNSKNKKPSNNNRRKNDRNKNNDKKD